jgi:hypothetical protein
LLRGRWCWTAALVTPFLRGGGRLLLGRLLRGRRRGLRRLLLGGRCLWRRNAAAIGRALLAAFLRGWCGPSLLSRRRLRR